MSLPPPSCFNADVDMRCFLHTNPMYDMEQKKRYQQIIASTEPLNGICQGIEKYVMYGQKMCSAFDEIIGSFSMIENVQMNKLFLQIFSSFRDIASIFRNHFDYVGSSIINPINNFLKNDVQCLTSIQKSFTSLHEKYIDSTDKYVSMPAKSQLKKVEAKKKVMFDSHRVSSSSFFEFVNQMDIIDLKFNNLIGSLLVSYVRSLLGPDEKTKLSSITQCLPTLHEIEAKSMDSNHSIVKLANSDDDKRCLIDQELSRYWIEMDMPYNGLPLDTIQGYLWKKTGRFSVSWERLFFVCSNGVLFSAESPELAHRPTWTINLLFCHVKPSLNEERHNCFSIISKDRTYIFQAFSQNDCSKWISTIQNCIVGQFHSQPSTPLMPTLRSVIPSQFKDNSCTDCGAPGAKWAVLNLGCPICDQCSGVHRSLGSKYSRVRSLTLDSIDRYSQELMKQIGSIAINSILEETIFNEKIEPNATYEQRSLFIRKKYIEKTFINTNNSPQPIPSIINRDMISILRCILLKTISIVDSHGLTPLHIACCIGDPAIVTILSLNNPEMLNQLDVSGWSPMSYAAYYNHFHAVDALLTFGADPLSSVAANPFRVAEIKGNEKICEKLVSFKPSSNSTESNSEIPCNEYKPQNIDISIYQSDDEDNQITSDEQIKLRRAVYSMNNRRYSVGPKRKTNSVFNSSTLE